MVSSSFGVLAGIALLFIAPEVRSVAIVAGGIAGFLASRGLLKRRNWARLSYIGVMGLAIAKGVIKVIVIPVEFRGMALMGAAAVALINGLIIAKLCSGEVREEFEAADQDDSAAEFARRSIKS